MMNVQVMSWNGAVIHNTGTWKLDQFSETSLLCNGYIQTQTMNAPTIICTCIQMYVCTHVNVRMYIYIVGAFTNSAIPYQAFPQVPILWRFRGVANKIMLFILEHFPPMWNISTTSGVNYKPPDTTVVGVAYQIGSYCQIRSAWCWAENHPCLSQW